MNKIRSILKILRLSLILTIPLILIQSATVHAYNGKGRGELGTQNPGQIGASQYNTAFMMYIAHAEGGTAATPGILVYNDTRMVSNDIKDKNFLTKTATGTTVALAGDAMTFHDTNAPSPIGWNDKTESWVLQGYKVRNYLMRKKDGKYWFEAIIENRLTYFNDDCKKAWENDISKNLGKYVVIVQPVAKLHCTTTYDRIATTDGWIEWIGDGYSHSYLTGAMYNCMTLEWEQFGLEAPKKTSGVYSSDFYKLRETGWGIHIIELESSSIRTYWEPNGSPGKPEPSEPDKTGTCAIIKGYYEENETTGTKTSLGVYTEQDTTYTIEICEEPEFEIVQWDISTDYDDSLDPTDWNVPGSISRSGDTPETVELDNPEKVVYVLLKRVIREEEEIPDVNYIISQSTITRQVFFSEPDFREGMQPIEEFNFTWEMPKHEECTGHTFMSPCTGNHTRTHTHTESCSKDDAGNITCTTQENYNCGSDCVSNTTYCTNYTWEDKELKFALKNNKASDYADILATKDGWQFVTLMGDLAKRIETYERTKKDLEEQSYNQWDYACVLLRGKDKLTIAEWKNIDLGTADANTDLNAVSSSGFAIANTDSGERKQSDFKEEFSTEITDDSVDKETTWKATVGAVINKSGATQNPPCKDKKQSTLKESLTIDVKVKLETYSGSALGGYDDTYYNQGIQQLPVSGYSQHTGREVPSGGSISFRPYVEMNYDTYTSYEKTAYVLGEYQRSMTPNDYAEICWNKPGGENLTLSSLQWSTHANAVNHWGTGNVLPGGATLTLGIQKSDMQTIVLTTYQCIVEGKGQEQIDKAGGSNGGLTRDAAVAAHEAYVNSVIAGLETLNVEQWVNKNVNAGTAWSSGGLAVNYGQSLSPLGGEYTNQTASEDMKYYFNDEGSATPASEGDLDVKKEGTTTKTYTFFTTTKDSSVRYVADNPDLPNTGTGLQGTVASDNISSMINQRTHVIDKLASAVEAGTGNDPRGRSKTGTNWYNEAFDGVSVVVQSTTLKLGYRDPAERSSVLDPKLTRKSTGQADMFKDKTNSYLLSQFKMKPYTNMYRSDDMVGTFKGADIYTNEMDMMYYTKKFWIPNVTTQDLH